MLNVLQYLPEPDRVFNFLNLLCLLSLTFQPMRKKGWRIPVFAAMPMDGVLLASVNMKRKKRNVQNPGSKSNRKQLKKLLLRFICMCL